MDIKQRQFYSVHTTQAQFYSVHTTQAQFFTNYQATRQIASMSSS